MAARNPKAQQLARQLAQLSVINGAVSAERVTGVLDYLQKNPPPQAIQVLKAYHRLIALELANSRAVVEHAGAVTDDALRAIEASLSRRYNRPITATARRNDTLIAGLRVRVADDVYESSVASQLAALSQAV